jgi:hypothetical protein
MDGVSKPELNDRRGWSLGLEAASGHCLVQLEPLPRRPFRGHSRGTYLNNVSTTATKAQVENVAAYGAPEDMCRYTGEEVHYYCLNAWRIAVFVRTGYSPRSGTLPKKRSLVAFPWTISSNNTR